MPTPASSGVAHLVPAETLAKIVPRAPGLTWLVSFTLLSYSPLVPPMNLPEINIIIFYYKASEDTNI